MARPKPIDRGAVKELREAGHTREEIARILGISVRTLQRRAPKDATLRAALAGRPGPGWPRGRRRRGARARQRHGHHARRATLDELATRVFDPETPVGRALIEWREAVIADLGGEGELSIQQRSLIDVLAREKLLLQRIDAWLLEQPRIVNGSQRAVYPVVEERTRLANAFAKRLRLLGLKRSLWAEGGLG